MTLVPRHRESVPLGSSASTTSGSSLPTYAPSSLATSSIAASTPPSQTSMLDAESLRLKLRIRDLEDQLSKLTSRPANPSPEPPHSNIQTLNSTLSGTFHVHCEGSSLGQQQAIARGVSHKTRLFGQSHWTVNGVLLVRLAHVLVVMKKTRLTSTRFAMSSSPSMRMHAQRRQRLGQGSSDANPLQGSSNRSGPFHGSLHPHPTCHVKKSRMHW